MTSTAPAPVGRRQHQAPGRASAPPGPTPAIPMGEPLWQLEQVSVAAKPRPRLGEVSLRIEPGVTAVIGYSGAGKTTLLNLLVGFEKPDAGRVQRSLVPPVDRPALFWVPQGEGLWSHLSARQHVEAVAAGAGPDRAAEAARWLAALDLADRAAAHPDELSQGERSRLALARALATRAGVQIMDEPLVHVDPARAGKYWRVIREALARDGASLVFATHTPATVLAEADHVIALRDGRVLYAGPTRSLYWEPATLEQAECLGETNWLEPAEARFWLGETIDRPRSYRPEQVVVAPPPDASDTPDTPAASPLRVRTARFCGAVAETELEHPATGAVRRFLHRPAGDFLRPGDRVSLSVVARLILLMSVLLTLAGCGGSDTGPALPVREVHYISMPPADDARIPAPRSMTVGLQHELYVLDRAARVLVYSSEGQFQRSWPMPEKRAGNPEGICVLSDGRIAVADTHYSRVVVFDREGKVLRMWGRFGDEPGQFRFPVGIARDEQDNLYVSEYGGNDRVQKFTHDGKLLKTFGRFGTGPGELQRPAGIVWQRGKLYLADSINNRVAVFSDEGQWVMALDGAGGSGAGAAPATGRSPIAGGGSPGEATGFYLPYDLSFDRDGALYVVEYGACRVSKLDERGKVLGRWGRPGKAEGQLNEPWGLAVDGRRVWVADTGNRRIVELKL